jgi:hypothetical protein
MAISLVIGSVLCRYLRYVWPDLGGNSLQLLRNCLIVSSFVVFTVRDGWPFVLSGICANRQCVAVGCASGACVWPWSLGPLQAAGGPSWSRSRQWLAGGTRDRAQRGRGKLNAAVRSLPSTWVHSARSAGQKSVRIWRKAGMLRARAWVPYGAGPLSLHCMPMRALLPAEPADRFCRGVLDPEGVCWCCRASRVQRGKGPASALLPTSPVTIPRQPKAAADA